MLPTGMLKITLHHSPSEVRLRLEGKLSGPWVGELRKCWITAASTTEGHSTVVDLREVDFVDSEGQTVLREMHDAGARFLADTPVIQAVLREIGRAPRCATVKDRTSPREDVAAVPSPSGPHPRAL